MVTPEKTVNEFLDALMNSKHEKLASILSDDVKILGSSGKRYGKKEIIKYFADAESPYGDRNYERVGTYVIGNTVIIESLMNAVHVGEYMGIPPSNKRFELPAVNVFEVENGKIKAWRQYQNNKILFDLTNP